MVWARLDDSILDNPKIASVGVLGFALHVGAITWCARNLSDGFIPAGRVGSLFDWGGVLERDREPDSGRALGGDGPRAVGFAIGWARVAQQLVDANLWHEVPGGYVVHDYLDFNPSRETALRQRAEKSEIRASAGRKGGLRSGEKTAKTLTCAAEAKAQQKCSKRAAKVQQTRSKTAANPAANVQQKHSPDPDPDPDPQSGEIPLPPSRAESATAGIDPLLAPDEPIPPACTARIATVELAVGKTPPVAAEWLKFVGHYAGRLRRSEAPGKWQQWLVRAIELQKRADQQDRDRANRPGYRPPEATPARPPPNLTRKRLAALDAERQAAVLPPAGLLDALLAPPPTRDPSGSAGDVLGHSRANGGDS